MISLWQMFDDVVSYEEDPSGTTAGIAAIQTKFNDEWKAYEAARRTIGQATKGRLKVYASRCEKILKTLFLYHVARMEPGGLPVEEIMNSVMEWQDHDEGPAGRRQGQPRPLRGALRGTGDRGAPGHARSARTSCSSPTGGKIDIKQLFQKARNQAEGQQVQQRNAWEPAPRARRLGDRDPILTIDLAQGVKSIFRGMAPAEQKDVEVDWHDRTIKGRVYMRDLLDIASKQASPPADQHGRHRPRLRRLHQQQALRRQGGRTRQAGEGPPCPVLDARRT